jgi:hypothetical protein
MIGRIVKTVSSLAVGMMVVGLAPDAAWGQVVTPSFGSHSGTGAVNGVNSSATNGSVGVAGQESATSGVVYGIYGETNSSTLGTTAVFGYSKDTTGYTAGVQGVSDSPIGYGVIGLNRATGGGGPAYGVYGHNNNNSGYGVFGWSTSATGVVHGVYGQTASPSGYGVLGVNTSGAGFAGYFSGAVHVAGNFSVTGNKQFKIDHPSDPENRYLRHAAIESPDMMNVYNGNVVVGADGTAEVELPAYFEDLNADYRYQLTTIGGFAPVYVAKEIEGNRFSIAGAKPGMKVSWMVTGVRHDPSAKRNQFAVEEMKAEADRGKYLDPVAYGKPAELGIGYAAAPEPALSKKVAMAVK